MKNVPYLVILSKRQNDITAYEFGALNSKKKYVSILKHEVLIAEWAQWNTVIISEGCDSIFLPENLPVG